MRLGLVRKTGGQSEPCTIKNYNMSHTLRSVVYPQKKLVFMFMKVHGHTLLFVNCVERAWPFILLRNVLKFLSLFS